MGFIVTDIQIKDESLKVFSAELIWRYQRGKDSNMTCEDIRIYLDKEPIKYAIYMQQNTSDNDNECRTMISNQPLSINQTYAFKVEYSFRIEPEYGVEILIENTMYWREDSMMWLVYICIVTAMIGLCGLCGLLILKRKIIKSSQKHIVLLKEDHVNK